MDHAARGGSAGGEKDGPQPSGDVVALNEAGGGGAVLIAFLKSPVPGRCKTRLAPPLAQEQAALLYRAMAQDTLGAVRRGPASVVIAYDPAPEFPTPDWAAPDLARFPQAGGDLGRRLESAFAEGFRRGRPVLALGTDAPTLPPERLEEALDALRENDLVLGPAADGGYYLIGLAREAPFLFQGIPWSTPGVLSATRRAAAEAGLKLAELAPHRDVDTPEDLEWLRGELAGLPASAAPATRSVLAHIGNIAPVRAQ